MSDEDLLARLRKEILFARQRVYEAGSPTPLDRIEDATLGFDLFVKREDSSAIHAYKWRGAQNAMAQLTNAQLQSGVVTASAGNHAQGVALAARKLKAKAKVFMPLSTPKVKQDEVIRHGGEYVTIELVGDTYDAASSAALAYGEAHGRVYIHAYDDLAVMAGQGTLADEVVLSGHGSFDFAILQVGGGGMAAATATWLKFHFPQIRIIGVEGVDQASMQTAIQNGGPVTLDEVDVFCDGTAVRRAGSLTYQICRDIIDEWITVTNDEVSAAVQYLWQKLRCIAEPSGAMGIAGALQLRERLEGARVLTVLCGANMDFERLSTIARRAAVGSRRRIYLKIQIKEEAGAMYRLLEELPASANIADFQYGKIDHNRASPVIGFDLLPEDRRNLTDSLDTMNYDYTEVTSDLDVAYRIIAYDSKLLKHPRFIQLEFHERAGALRDFLEIVSQQSNLCYFNYLFSGERVGRALLGFEFEDATQAAGFEAVLEQASSAYRTYEFVSEEILHRILK